MALPMKNFRLQRGADRFGPKQLLVVEVDLDATRLGIVSRNGKVLKWEMAKTLPYVDDKYQIGHESLANFLKKDEYSVGRYASVIVNSRGSFVRLLNFSGQPGRSEAVAREVRQTLGVDDEYDVRHRVVRRSEGKEGKNSEYAVLAAAIPRPEVEQLRGIVADAGLTPVSLIPQGIGVANLAEISVDLMTNDKALGFLWVGNSSSMLILYAGENLALARQFKTGFNALLETVMKDYGLDEETAAKFVASGSFDFSGNLSAAAKSWMHQVGISLDFIERRYGQRVEDLYVLSTAAGTPVLTSAFKEAVDRNIEVWDAVSKIGIEGNPSQAGNQGLEFAIALCEARRIMQEGLNANA